MRQLDPREDLHALMAVRLYCVPLHKVTPELRAKSKLHTFGWRYTSLGKFSTRDSELDARAERVRRKVDARLSGNPGEDTARTFRRRQALVSACQLFGNMLSDRGGRLKTRLEWLADREHDREGGTHPCTCWHGLRCECRGACGCHYASVTHVAARSAS